MILPNGVTGLYDSKANKPPQVDGKLFKQLCFDFGSRNRGKVINFYTPQYPSNFYYVQVEIGGNSFYILLNEHYPFLAFASEVEYGNIKFINRLVANEPLSSFYRVISTGELYIPVNQELIKYSELNSAELEQIAYWKPETVGHILFNYWD